MTDARDDRPALDRWFGRVFDDDESSRLGSGWLSGTGHLPEPAGLAAWVRARAATWTDWPGRGCTWWTPS